ncbi:MAG: acetate kinase [Lachnospiraceae bacterium]|nr:acetate kinase [Lachnospiraceae bacterium]
MKILVLNCGSSSFKYQLINMENDEVMAKGNYERIAIGESFLTHTVNGEKHKFTHPVNSHKEAIAFVMTQLTNSEYGVIESLDEISAIGHRVVHGGEKFTSSVIVNDEVIAGIEDAIKFAPLHNPAALQGINACIAELPGKKNVTVFDTAFHQTMPKEHYIYPIPYEYYEKYGIRKYGAHGTSHKYVSQRIAHLLNKNVEDLKIVNCHIGQGASICAIQGGKCVDTSMGLTPLGGIPMGTRSGDLDPSVVTYIMKQENLSAEEVENLLNKKSGILGMSMISADNRDIDSAAAEGNEQAQLALKIYSYLIAQYIGRYAVTMNGVDVITFTAGVGENGPETREMICEYLGFLGVDLDKEVNNVKSKELEISKKDSKVKVWIVPTNEELMIARETMELTK